MSDALWRPMAAADLPAVAAIADIVHPGFFEAPEVLAEKRALFPDGCLLLEGDAGPMGYIFTHPWPRGSLPALDRLIGALPEGADSYYIHDLALLPAARGTGAAGAAVARSADLALAKGFAQMSLVAVNGSIPFWTRHGFAVSDAPALAAKLSAYEPAARLMVRQLVEAG
jgi:GNAT superfamily N-acetyltransferase